MRRKTRSQRPEAERLLATKLHAPQLRADRLERRRLIAQIEAALARRLVLVSAPAGFGKSTLLAEWAHGTHRRVAWVSLEPDDNDPARFWSYVVEAVDALRPGAKTRVALPAAHEPAPAIVVGALIDELVRSPAELVIVLDDYHVIDAQLVHQGLASLVEHLPPAVHLVIATRSDPPLPLTSLRTRALMEEVRQGDLRFTSDEAAALLRHTWKLPLSEASLATLAQKTEGWAAGYQLAALGLKGSAEADDAVARFSGGHRYVLDYLTEEVLDRESTGVRRFLLETSILERLTAQLCDEVTGAMDGQSTLEQLESANLFIEALDEERHWYRYHHLFADLLRARLSREHPEEIPELHWRAAAWHEEHGLIGEAIRHAVASGDVERAAGLVEAHADETVARGEGETLRRWLAALPVGAVRARPRLCVIQAISAANAGRLELVEPLLAAAEAGIAHQPAVAQAPSADGLGSAIENLPATIANLRATMATLQGDPDRASVLAQETLARLAATERGARLSSEWNLAAAKWTGGRLDDASNAFARMVQLGQAHESSYLVLTASAWLGRIQQAQGRLSAALGTYQQALDWTTAIGGPHSPAAGAVLIGIARVLYERDQLDDAVRQVTQGIELARYLNAMLEPALGLVTLARIRETTGDRAGAHRAMAEAQALYPDTGAVSLHNPVPAEAANLALRSGRIAEAAAWIEGRGLQDGHRLAYPREGEHLVLARLWLARKQPDAALALLARIRALAEQQQREASVVEALVLETLACHQIGDRQTAEARLAEAVRRGEAEGYVRIFVDESPIIASLAAGLIAGERRAGQGRSTLLLDHLRLVQRAGLRAGPGKASASASADRLTDREREVLRMIALGKRNQEIAHELVVTLDTVKKHAAHVFEKLGVASRTQAVTEARKLGLVE